MRLASPKHNHRIGKRRQLFLARNSDAPASECGEIANCSATHRFSQPYENYFERCSSLINAADRSLTIGTVPLPSSGIALFQFERIFAGMQTARNELAMCCATSRSKISNGTRLLSNVDGRSREARRFRDLVASFATEIGTDLGEVEMGLVRQAAGLALRAEQLQEAIVRGEPVDNDDLIRISGTSRRILTPAPGKGRQAQAAAADSA